MQSIVYAAKTDISMDFCFRGFIFIFVLATVKSCFSFDHCVEFYFKGEDHGALLRPASIFYIVVLKLPSVLLVCGEVHRYNAW